MFVLILDQFTKIYIKTHFYYEKDVKVLDFFHLTFIENPGMAYGIEFGGETGKLFLGILRILLITGMIYLIIKWSKTMKTFYFYLPSALILSGAIGNLLDNLFYGMIFDKGLVYDPVHNYWRSYVGIAQLTWGEGYSGFFQGVVVDFIRLPIIDTFLPDWVPIWGGERFQFFKPIFNIADASITIGGFWLIIFRKKALPK